MADLSKVAPSASGGYQNLYPREYMAVPTGRTLFHKLGSQDDIVLVRQAESLVIDRDGYSNDVKYVSNGDKLTIDRDGYANDVTFKVTQGEVNVDRNGYEQDLTVRRSGNSIKIDREGYSRDINIVFEPNQITIDQDGLNRDVTIRYDASKERVTVDRPGYGDDIDFPVTLFQGGWPTHPSLLSVAEWIDMPAATADALDRWSTEGRIALDDLVRVNKQASILNLDSNFS
jgi:hypothetical protein